MPKGEPNARQKGAPCTTVHNDVVRIANVARVHERGKEGRGWLHVRQTFGVQVGKEQWGAGNIVNVKVGAAGDARSAHKVGATAAVPLVVPRTIDKADSCGRIIIMIVIIAAAAAAV